MISIGSLTTHELATCLPERQEHNLSFALSNNQDTHVCENQDDILIHTTNLSHTFALPQFMAQHNFEDLKPTDTPSTVLTALKASSDHTFKPMCAHNFGLLTT